MKQKLIYLLLLTVPEFFLSCTLVAPVTNQYEKAATLKKGNTELMGHFTAYGGSGNGESEAINNNFGFRFGYGLSDKVDLKFRYERLVPSDNIDDEARGANYFSLIPKFSLVPDKFSLLVPISHYSAKRNDVVNGEDDFDYSFSSAAPHLIYTFTGAKNKTDFSLGLKADILFTGDVGSVLLGATAGAGLSSDLNKWAIRPEVGILSIGGGAFLSYGVGLQFLLSKKRTNGQ